MRIAFLGTGAIGVPSLQTLARSSLHEICGVFTQPDRPAGRTMKLRPSPIKLAATEQNIPIFQPEKIRAASETDRLAALAPDLIVVIAYGQILPRQVLDLPPLGCLNVHASLLPRHRGASPINAAILAGDPESGVSIMWMDAGLDTGDVLLQKTIDLAPTETAGHLHDRLAQLAPEAVLEALTLIKSGDAPRKPQNADNATHAPKLTRAHGQIDWHKPADAIDRQIRGLTPWPGAYTWLPSEPAMALKIHSATPEPEKSGNPGAIMDLSDGILVAAGAGSILLREVQIAGGRRLNALEFLRGHRLNVGAILPSVF